MSKEQSATYDTFEQWWKANAYKFPQADYAANSYEEIARAAWEARAMTLQNAAPQASSTQDSTRMGDDIGPSARHPTEKETGGAPAVAAPQTTLSETAPSEALKLAEQWKGRADDAGRLSRAVIESAPSEPPQKPIRRYRASVLDGYANIKEHPEGAYCLYSDVQAALASAPSATPQKPPRDPNVKYPRLFYWEDAEDCWCPAEELEVENIISAGVFLADGEISEVRFKRMDMTDAEYDAIPEG